MSWGIVASVGGSIVGGMISSGNASDAATDANNATIDANQQAIAEQRRQFDAIQELLKPYVTAGGDALGAQGNLVGLNGAAPQRAAIDALMKSPAFTSLTASGENAILQNAAATGGLRGGNTQAALAKFRPELLSQLIQQQFSNLGGLTSIGQNSAANTGAFGQAAGSNISQLLQNIGASNAGNAKAQATADNQGINSILGGFGKFFGGGGLEKLGGLF